MTHSLPSMGAGFPYANSEDSFVHGEGQIHKWKYISSHRTFSLDQNKNFLKCI